MTVKQTEKKRSGRHVLTEAGPGRPKGSKNKFTTLKAAFLGAFERLGGEDELLTWADKSARNRELFYGWMTKLFPQEVAHSGKIESGGTFNVKVVHTKSDGNRNNGNGSGNGQEGAK